MVYNPDEDFSSDEIHVTGGILGPNEDEIREGEDFTEESEENQENELKSDLVVKPGNIYTIFYAVGNSDQFTRLEVIDKAKEKFLKVESDYNLKRLKVKYDGEVVAITFKSLKMPEGQEGQGEIQNVSFVVGFTVASVAFLLIDLLEEVRLNFIGGKKVKGGSFLSSFGGNLGTIVGAGIVGFLFLGLVADE
jgi:hypothetical protein